MIAALKRLFSSPDAIPDESIASAYDGAAVTVDNADYWVNADNRSARTPPCTPS